MAPGLPYSTVERKEGPEMGGPWRERGFDPRPWRRPVPQAQTATAAPATREAVIALTWLATVVVAAAVMMFLASAW